MINYVNHDFFSNNQLSKVAMQVLKVATLGLLLLVIVMNCQLTLNINQLQPVIVTHKSQYILIVNDSLIITKTIGLKTKYHN